MIKQEWKSALILWATRTPAIRRVYIVGSRARNTDHQESDLDVAIELVEGLGYSEWFFNSDGWKADLQSQLDVTLHLLRGNEALGNALIETAVSEHGVLVFDNSAKTTIR